MKKILLLSTFLAFNIVQTYSIENRYAGARSVGLSQAYVSFSDTWSTFHNQAGLATFQNMSAGIFYESKFMIDELSEIAGSIIMPAGNGNFGLSLYQFGKGTYKENKYGLAFAKRLGKNISAGIQFDYFSQTFPENKRSRGFVTFEGGIIFLPTEKLHLGAHIFNPIMGGIDTQFGKEKVPFTFRIGGHYVFDESVLITVETEKDSVNPFLLKTGFEFKPLQNIAFRAGISGTPLHYTAGIGYSSGKITTDFGFSYHGNLGLSPSVSLQFKL